MSQQGLVAWCPRCREYKPADTFAGLTFYREHANPNAPILWNYVRRLCQNSNKPTPYKAKQSFAGHLKPYGDGERS